jgi:hypothetical protein
VVSIQYEYRLFGGRFGKYIRSFLEELEKPAVLTLHTVLEHPNTALRHLTEEVAAAAAGVVVLAERAKRVLADYYPHGGLASVHFIPHSTPSVPYAPTARFKNLLGLAGCTILSTFGLLGSEKGSQLPHDSSQGLVSSLHLNSQAPGGSSASASTTDTLLAIRGDFAN